MVLVGVGGVDKHYLLFLQLKCLNLILSKTETSAAQLLREHLMLPPSPSSQMCTQVLSPSSNHTGNGRTISSALLPPHSTNDHDADNSEGDDIYE
jgi:hypothetical protein